jgi:hypothetical protein
LEIQQHIDFSGTRIFLKKAADFIVMDGSAGESALDPGV